MLPGKYLRKFQCLIMSGNSFLELGRLMDIHLGLNSCVEIFLKWSKKDSNKFPNGFLFRLNSYILYSRGSASNRKYEDFWCVFKIKLLKLPFKRSIEANILRLTKKSNARGL